MVCAILTSNSEFVQISEFCDQKKLKIWIGEKMLKETIFLIFYMLFIVVYEAATCIKKENYREWKKFVMKAAFYIYIFLLIKVTIFPIPYQKTELDSLRKSFGEGLKNNFVPLFSIRSILEGSSGFLVKLRQLGGNLILLFPLAFYIPLTKKRFRKPVKILMLLFGVSCTVEIVQFLIGRVIHYNYRVVDIDDVILNVCGGMLGYFAWKLFQKIIEKR